MKKYIAVVIVIWHHLKQSSSSVMATVFSTKDLWYLEVWTERTFYDSCFC